MRAIRRFFRSWAAYGTPMNEAVASRKDLFSARRIWNMTFRLWNGEVAADSSPDEVRSFVEAITGRSTQVLPEACSDQAAEAELREFVRAISTDHDHWNPNRDRDIHSDRASTGWMGEDSFSDGVPSFVKAIRGESTPVSTESFSGQPTTAQIQEFLRNIHERYNPSEPRDAIGQWTSDGGGSGGGTGRKQAGAQAPKPAERSRHYLPSDTKGTWKGTPGNGKFELEKPIIANGKRVTHIEFKNGLPVLDKFILPGKTATIILTGENGIDQANAKRAWQELNPGKELPPNSVFHHDLRRINRKDYYD
jgi:hypothetical protein